MDSLQIVQNIFRATEPAAAVRSIVETFPPGSLRCCLWIEPSLETRFAWPEGTELTAELRQTALHLRQPESFPLRSEFPAESARYPDSDILFLPLRDRDALKGAIILIASAGILEGVSPDEWPAVGEAILLADERHAKLLAAQERTRELQRRVEESEALHTLGLAANRTLHPDEVLHLVARFARSLLGADYVTVSTAQEGRIYTVASVGVRDPDAAEDDYRLARNVVDSEKPVILGGSGGPSVVDQYPFHHAEGMRAGLGIPLSLFGETFGALIVGYRSAYEVSPRDVRFALTLAGHAAVAISNARLHGNVKEKSEELQRAYEELRELTRMKEMFFASINHELRNPIGAVMGYLTLVLEGTVGEIPAGARAFLEKASRSAKTLLELVNDILDLSKIAAGKMEIEPQPVSLRYLMDGTLNTVQPLAEQRGVPLQVEAQWGEQELVTDPKRVQQILVNLLSNAIKFTGPEGVRLSAGTVDASDGGNGVASNHWVDFRVEDTGPGLSPENQALIFEEFTQVKGTSGGTGLGLPISRRLARLLGGELFVESELGSGSTFVLRLPQKIRKPAEAGAEA